MDREDHRDGQPLHFYCVDSEFGPFFLKFCSYFPYNAKLCIFSELFQITKVGVARLS